MTEVLVVLHADGIPAAYQVCMELARRPGCEYEVHAFDPELCDRLLAGGVTHVKLHLDPGLQPYAVYEGRARRRAYELEAELDLAHAAATGTSLLGWQFLCFYYVFMAMQWYTDLAKWFVPRVSGQRVHLFINARPGQYFFDSFVPAVMLLQELRRCGAAVVAYDYGGTGDIVHLVPDLRDAVVPDGALLTHLPTCFYDGAHFTDELRASGRPCIDLQSAYWDVVIEPRARVGLTDVRAVLATLAADERERMQALEAVLRPALHAAFEEYLGSQAHRCRQVDHVVAVWRAQWVTYLELQRVFGTRPPATLVLSEHDGGLHGPLVAFAAARGIRVILLPHSKAICEIEFDHPALTALTHPVQARAIHSRGGRKVRREPLRYPELHLAPPPPGAGLRTLSLLINGLSLNGIPFAATAAYLGGMKRLAEWCRASGVTIKVRSKPGTPLTALLGAYVGLLPAEYAVSSDSLETHLAGCDLGVMYDTPTTAALHYLRCGIPLLHAMVVPCAEALRVSVRDELVESESVDAVLDRLEGFKREPAALYDLRHRQYQGYVACFRDARPLRDHL